MKLIKMFAVVLTAMFFSVAANAGDKVKVGFIYVGPIGDHGWTYRHDIGRLDVEQALLKKVFGDKCTRKTAKYDNGM